ncbi:recombinase family protein [Marivita sp.]|uniref:recombinase family protein n=1 Tax=Marivita sp. TaxID=2003365 RepID=UPI002624A549|nr:recombinase family protein [Marivita sp.]
MESGGRDDRLELDNALNLARLAGATLVIAKLDRLSRNAAFLLTFHLTDRSHRLPAGPLQRFCSDLPPRNLKPPKGYGFRFRGGRSCATRHPRTRDFIIDTTSCGRQSIDTKFCKARCANGSGK